MKSQTDNDEEKTSSLRMVVRSLNDYECMLASGQMTCNVAVRLKIPLVERIPVDHNCHDADERARIEAHLRNAWDKCVEEYEILQCRLEHVFNDDGSPKMGKLGPKYNLVKRGDDQSNSQWCRNELFTVEYAESESNERLKDEDEITRNLQHFGVTALDSNVSTFKANCTISSSKEEDGYYTFVTLMLSLCHSGSDGPGTMMVAKSFLENLRNELSEGKVATSRKIKPRYSAIDLQSLILGKDYGANDKAKANKDTFEGLDVVISSLKDSSAPKIKGIPFLPPEALQGIPSDMMPSDEVIKGGFIDAIHATLSKEETRCLLANCRATNATIQGALTVACLIARVSLLKKELPLCAAVQVPANCRNLIQFIGNATISKETIEGSCLCGSAALWHMVELHDGNQLLLDIAAKATYDTRNAIQEQQHREWLRRLMNDPSTLPPYSIMESSIGIAPVNEIYKDSANATDGDERNLFQVEDFQFIGGAIKNDNDPVSDPPPQATMVHASGFAEQMQFMFNFTWPGISKQFAHDNVYRIKVILLEMSKNPSATVGSMLESIS